MLLGLLAGCVDGNMTKRYDGPLGAPGIPSAEDPMRAGSPNSLRIYDQQAQLRKIEANEKFQKDLRDATPDESD